MRVRLAIKQPPGEGEAGVRNIRERVGPFLEQEPGFLRGWWMDDAARTGLSITVWDDDEIEAHETALRVVPGLPDIDPSLIRQPDERHVLDVEASLGLEEAGAAFGRIAWFDAGEPAAESGWVQGHLVPALTGVEGFLTLVLARDVESSRIVSLTLWARETALRGGEDAVAARADAVGIPLPRPRSVELFRVWHEAQLHRARPGRHGEATGAAGPSGRSTPG